MLLILILIIPKVSIIMNIAMLPMMIFLMTHFDYRDRCRKFSLQCAFYPLMVINIAVVNEMVMSKVAVNALLQS